MGFTSFAKQYQELTESRCLATNPFWTALFRQPYLKQNLSKQPRMMDDKYMKLAEDIIKRL